jgi:predicted metal-dependent hydrolase
MVVVKELEWMRSYIESVTHLLPKIKQLKKISSRRGSKEYWQHFHGLITYFDKKSFRITLYITYHDTLADKIKNYSTLDVLQYLAHELAHLEHWDHTPQHKQLECIIMSIFMTKLTEAGYISEEAEAKNGKFY